MRLLLLGVALLILAAVLEPRDAVEVAPRATSRAPPPPPPGIEQAVRHDVASPGATGKRAAAAIDAPRAVAVAVAPAASTPTNNAVARRPDASLQTRAVHALPRASTRSFSTPGTSRARLPTEAIASMSEAEDSDDPMGPLARLYLAYFRRLPDFEGFEYYIAERNEGRPLPEIADEFAGSREFAQLYGAVDNARFLDLIAQNVDSGIDPDQRAQWLAQLDSGAVTRGQVMLALSESDDFRELAHGHVLVAIEGLRRTRNPH